MKCKRFPSQEAIDCHKCAFKFLPICMVGVEGVEIKGEGEKEKKKTHKCERKLCNNQTSNLAFCSKECYRLENRNFFYKLSQEDKKRKEMYQEGYLLRPFIYGAEFTPTYYIRKRKEK